LTVNNYYKLNPQDCLSELKVIRNWVFDYPNHPQIDKALFALDVCYCAVNLKRDDFICLTLAFLV